MHHFKSIHESPNDGQKIAYFYEPAIIETGTYYSEMDNNAPFIIGDNKEIISIDSYDELWWIDREKIVLDDEFIESV